MTAFREGTRRRPPSRHPALPLANYLHSTTERGTEADWAKVTRLLFYDTVTNQLIARCFFLRAKRCHSAAKRRGVTKGITRLMYRNALLNPRGRWGDETGHMLGDASRVHGATPYTTGSAQQSHYHITTTKYSDGD